MSRINTNVSSLIAQRVLRSNTDAVNTSLQRLSTGLKINKGSDNPAGLIASENLRAEKAGILQAIDNAGRASNIIGTAEGGLTEVSSLLTELQSLVNQSANSGGLSAEEKAANQLQVDSILNTINRIAGSTAFQGAKLLNGQYAYTTSAAAASALRDDPDQRRQPPRRHHPERGRPGRQQRHPGPHRLHRRRHRRQRHRRSRSPALLGTQQLSFAGSTTIANIATAINNISAITGVTASAAGTDAGVQGARTTARRTSSPSAPSPARRSPSPAASTARTPAPTPRSLLNGAAALVKGLDVSFRDAGLDIEFQLTTQGYNGLTATGLNNGGTKTFGITGGGAKFSLGAKVTETDKANIGIQSVSTTGLGNAVNGYLSSLSSGGANSLSSGSLVNAQRILDVATKQVSQLRGRLGAFQKFAIGSTVNSLGVAYENIAAAESAIRDTDFSEETAKLTRAQILTQAATVVLAQANAAPQSALTLLQG